MRVRVRFFAALREAAGQSEQTLDLPAGARVAEAWSALVAQHVALAPHGANLAAAVNRRYVAREETLAEGDELVFVPPVSGGCC